MHTMHVLATALLASAVLAQGTVVSPVSVAAIEGASNNAFPFNSPVIRRYMQLHGDLGTTPLLITQLSFRVNASATNYVGTRAIDMELFMGHGVPALQPSFTFDTNYILPKTLVIPRTIVNFGPTGQAVTPGPNSFAANMDLVLPAPFVYFGIDSLVWEVTHFGTTTSGSFSQLDADGSSTTTGASTITGTGCQVASQAALMTHTFTCIDVAGQLIMWPTVSAGPTNSLCLFAIGLSNPGLSVPGLCATVYTDALITSILGFTTATGTFTADTPGNTIRMPNQLTGVTLFTQAFALDATSTSPIQFAASNGRMVTVPTSNFARSNNVTRLWNNLNGTAATEGIVATTSIGYGLVTQFSHQ